MFSSAGSRTARHAWWGLRGPYLITYALLLWLAVATGPIGPESYFWKTSLALLMLVTLIGSLASYLVVGVGRISVRMHRLEVLEVTGLRGLVFVQLAYGVYIMATTMMESRALVHLIFGTFALGALNTLTWSAKKSPAPTGGDA